MLIKLIANPTAGRGSNKVIERVCAYLTERGNTVDIFLTCKRGDALNAAREVRDGRVDLIIAAGGDGTINEVANGLAGSSIPLGIIPLGTVNVFALETGIPMDPLKACDVLLNGTPTRISLGKVNDHHFLLMAGIGFDAYVVYGLDLRLKRLSGRLSYIISGIGRIFTYSGQPLEIELDNGERLEG
ncbi:MAG: diacylglycerol kinase family protein, partial [Deltaproteobacteria bacterium]